MTSSPNKMTLYLFPITQLRNASYDAKIFSWDCFIQNSKCKSIFLPKIIFFILVGNGLRNLWRISSIFMFEIMIFMLVLSVEINVVPFILVLTCEVIRACILSCFGSVSLLHVYHIFESLINYILSNYIDN